jgi:hypothetical protein
LQAFLQETETPFGGVAHPTKPCFWAGFLTEREWTWMPETLRILRDELPNIDVMISSQCSPRLASPREKSLHLFCGEKKGCPGWRSASRRGGPSS